MKKSPIKIVPRTADQIQRDNEIARKRKFIIDKFFPALKEATISVDESTMLLQATVALVMEEAMETLRTKKVKDIKNRLIKRLAPNDERLLQIERLIGLFDDLTLFETRGHFESMKAVIEQMKIDEMQARKLDSFTIDWDRMLT